MTPERDPARCQTDRQTAAGGDSSRADDQVTARTIPEGCDVVTSNAVDLSAPWHRYRSTTPAPRGPRLYAIVGDALLHHPLLTERARRLLVTDVWCQLYETLMATGHGSRKGFAGEVDPCQIAAALQVSDRTVRRALATLVQIGAVVDRRRIGDGNTIWVRLDVARFGIPPRHPR